MCFLFSRCVCVPLDLPVLPDIFFLPFSAFLHLTHTLHLIHTYTFFLTPLTFSQIKPALEGTSHDQRRERRLDHTTCRNMVVDDRMLQYAKERNALCSNFNLMVPCLFSFPLLYFSPLRPPSVISASLTPHLKLPIFLFDLTLPIFSLNLTFCLPLLRSILDLCFVCRPPGHHQRKAYP